MGEAGRHQPQQTLGLGGDGDDAELVQAIERAFDLRFADAETASWRTAGDIHKTLLDRMPESPAGACATSMAFYRLRSGLEAVRRGSGAIRPQTPSRTGCGHPSPGGETSGSRTSVRAWSIGVTRGSVRWTSTGGASRGSSPDCGSHWP